MASNVGIRVMVFDKVSWIHILCKNARMDLCSVSGDRVTWPRYTMTFWFQSLLHCFRPYKLLDSLHNRPFCIWRRWCIPRGSFMKIETRCRLVDSQGTRSQCQLDGQMDWASNRGPSRFAVTLFSLWERRSLRSQFLALGKILEQQALLWIWPLNRQGDIWL